MNRCSMLRRAAMAALLVAASGLAQADGAQLRAQYEQMREPLRNNSFGRALVIHSQDTGDTIVGDVHAVLDFPFKVVSEGLAQPQAWCDVLILPFNTKYCHPFNNAAGANLQMRIGRKADQPLADAYRLDFAFRPVARTADYMETELSAAKGPLGTRDYHIVLSVTPLDERHSFIHLSYTYGYGGFGRIAMQTYLNTVGASKVGFTVTGREPNGQVQYIGGIRGAIERNVVRYYLAIDSYLASLTAPPEQQLDRRLQGWFNATEKYARQLHEMDRGDYLAMKKHESERQQALLD
ncbi:MULTISPECIES: hypothetical protein [Ramlibacter]|uniref:Uncharacterized protein n=1 Tax=Ramlibacter aquaticus TaxID=2780094 RepID=A0ABR9SIJ6_9BURK|nr:MULTISPECIES: hypothetical protein [Ramlibacter]MBE7941842.1 hypothetical protein [Ramlibacter aquaticus]